MATLKPRPEVSYYCVAFLDLLNQRDRLARAEQISLGKPITQEIEKEWIGILSDLATFRQLVDATLTSMSARQSDHPRIREMWSTPIAAQLFSDSAVIFTRLHTRDAAVAAAGMHKLLEAVAHTMAGAFQRRLVLRGGIDVGAAAEIFDGETSLYGPALYRAYQLESQKADYPRVALGSALISFLETLERVRSDSFCREAVLVARRYIRIDEDNLPALDFVNCWGTESDDVRRLALEFAEKERTRFTSEGNEKLARKYERLIAFLGVGPAPHQLL